MDSSSFRRDYAKALGEALRDAEELQSTPDPETLLEETYRQLCYDCPIGISARACRDLGRILLREETGMGNPERSKTYESYVLSDRFVSGLLQALDRIEESSKSTTIGKDESMIDQTPQEPLFVHHEDRDTDSALTELAWNVFGRIPLKVLTARSLEDAASIIGNFRGDSDSALTNDELQESSVKPIEDPTEDGSNDATGQVSGANSDAHATPTDELVELWAEDSDDSDFEFESDRFQTPQHWPPSDQDVIPGVQSVDSWQDVAQAAATLLSHCTFSKLSSLSMSQWRKLNVSSHIIQLSLMLLLEEPSSPIQNAYPAHFWQRLALYPVHYFRDATFHHMNDLLEDYLQFLSTLLQAQAVASSNAATTSLQRLLPCTVLGISLLSALCSTLLGDQVPRQPRATVSRHLRRVRQTILESSDELTMILEYSMSHTCSTQSNGEASSMIPWIYVSILKATAAASGGADSGRDHAQAQTLLNSGLFRQWLKWWEQLYATSHHAARNSQDWERLRVVQDSIFDLCLVWPKILGKYAWRLPGFAAAVCQAPDASDDTRLAPRLVDVTLWNLLAAELIDTVSAAPIVVWKTKPEGMPNNATITLLMCREGAWSSFQRLCSVVSATLSDWRNCRDHNMPVALKLKHEQDAVTCLITLLDRFTMDPQLMTADFLARLTACGDAQSSDAIQPRNARPIILEPILQVLTHWPVIAPVPPQQSQKWKSAEAEDVPTHSGNDTDEGRQAFDLDDESTASIRRTRLQDQRMDDAVQRLRRSLKSFQSVVDAAMAEDPQGGRVSRAGVSSKAD